MSNVVEFRGAEEVLEGYRFHVENNHCAMFSLWCGKDLRFPFTTDDQQEGENVLAENLKMLERSRTTAIYTLRFHNALDKRGTITNNTPYSSSFNFKMNDYQGYAPGGSMQPFQPVPNQQILDLLTKMDQRLTAVEQGAIGEAETSKEDFILSIMENPMTQFLAGVVVDKLFPGQNYSQRMSNEFTRSGGIAGDPDNNQEINLADQQKKIQAAVNILFEVDPQLGDHLLALARMAKTNPKKYRMALSFL